MMRTQRRLTAGGLLAASVLLLCAVAPGAAAGTDPGTTEPRADEAVSQPAPAPDPSPAPVDQAEEPAPGATDAPGEGTTEEATDDPADDITGTASIRIEPYELLPTLVPDDEQVTWSYLVTNDGDVDVTDLVLTDSTGATVTCPLSVLAPGAQMICSVATVFGD